MLDPVTEHVIELWTSSLDAIQIASSELSRQSRSSDAAPPAASVVAAMTPPAPLAAPTKPKAHVFRPAAPPVRLLARFVWKPEYIGVIVVTLVILTIVAVILVLSSCSPQAAEVTQAAPQIRSVRQAQSSDCQVTDPVPSHLCIGVATPRGLKALARLRPQPFRAPVTADPGARSETDLRTLARRSSHSL